MKEGTPKGIRDRFKGRSVTNVTRARHWDTGARKGYLGAEVAPYKGSVGQVADAAKVSQGRVSRPGRAANPESGEVKSVGYPMTGGPHMSLGKGHGPTVNTRKQKGGGANSGNPQHSSSTGGADKGPPMMKGQGKGFAAPGSRTRKGRMPKMVKRRK